MTEVHNISYQSCHERFIARVISCNYLKAPHPAPIGVADDFGNIEAGRQASGRTLPAQRSAAARTYIPQHLLYVLLGTEGVAVYRGEDE